eukprot:TRINITY_DN2505_c0_g2_i1.p1 TRINITY_DN2505_c0_g2~~TRINITY_DN2505_c0_g2_i1.p1  ORF type:complete len:256 (+),score=61.29 TRINITY_DN2505_c0_g2_i1:117-884(+)
MVSTSAARAAAAAAAAVAGRWRASSPLSPPAWPGQSARARCGVSFRSNHPPSAPNFHSGGGGGGDGAGNRGGVGVGDGRQGGPPDGGNSSPLGTPAGAGLAAGGGGGGAGGLLAAAAAWEGGAVGTAGAADGDASASRERLVINGYGDTSLTVSGVRVSSPVLLFPHFPTYWEIPSLAAALTPDALTLVKVVRPRPAVLLLGLPMQVPLPPELRAWATAMGVGVEVMGVGEACHTFNLLNGDGWELRSVVSPEVR